jgi:multiple sugar transport system substrate-binding protein
MLKKLLFIIVALSMVLAACTPAATPAPTEQPSTGNATSAPAPTAVPANTEAPAATEAPAPTEAAMGETVDLKVMVVDYIPDTTDKWLEDTVVPAFQEMYPNVNVEFIYVNWGTLDETVAGYFAAGEGADIINLGSEYVAQYGDQLAPLNQYLGEAAWPDIKQFVPGTLDTVTWKDELRGLPWLTAPRAYMCRMDLLKTAGITEIPTTYDAWLQEAASASIVEGGAVKQAGLVTTGRLDDWQEYLSLIWGLGETLYNSDGSPRFDTPEAKAALQFMYDRRRAVYPDETVADLPEAQGSRLVDGSAACLWANMWGAPPADDPIWENISLTAGPTNPDFPNSKPVSQVFNDWLAVPAYSKNVEMAAEFLKFLGSADNLYEYNSGFGSFPPRQDAWKGYVTDTALMKNLGDIMSQYGVGFADIRQTAQFREILQREMPAYFTDLQDLETTLTNIQTQYTQALQDAGLIQ